MILATRMKTTKRKTISIPRSRLILPDEFWEGPDNVPDINTYIHQRLTVALQRGRIPWRVPVSHDPNCGLPCNVRTGGRYRGVNTLMLCDTYVTKGYRRKWWGSSREKNVSVMIYATLFHRFTSLADQTT